MALDDNIVFVANTNFVELRNLKSVAEETFIDDADVTVTIVDTAGQEVAGGSWPQAMPFVEGSDGKYRAVISEDVAIEPGKTYTAHVHANAGDGRVGDWQAPIRSKRRQNT